jgi:hypothetical protein
MIEVRKVASVPVHRFWICSFRLRDSNRELAAWIGRR